MNTNQHTQPLDRLRIWQQNLNASSIAQLALINTTTPADWDVLALQEPALNQLGNTKANSHWRVQCGSLKIGNSTIVKNKLVSTPSIHLIVAFKLYKHTVVC